MTEAELMEEYLIRQARARLESFVSLTMPDFIWDWFPRLLCRILEEFYDEVQMGNNPRYMIFAPPRSGKTEIVSRRFPAWVLGNDNTIPYIGCSYGSTLSSQNSRDVQRIIESDSYGRVFPDTVLPTRASAGTNHHDNWEILNADKQLTGGIYRSAGVTGGITGHGFKIGSIDDPVKDYADAASKKKQEAVKQWYHTTFYTRRHPQQNGVLVIQTRWHKKDLSGYLLDEMAKGEGGKWKVFSFPMELEDEQEAVTVGGRTYYTRQKGGILFPLRMSQEFVNDCKQSPLTWAALYQQRPTLDGGDFFKSDWFQYYDGAPHPFDRIIITGDTANKTGETHDYSVFQVWGRKNHQIFLLDQIRGKWESAELLATAKAFWDSWGGGVRGPEVRASSVFIEDKASGTGLIQDLRKKGVPVVGIPRLKDKACRAIDKQARFASGMVVLPRYAPWLAEYLMEFEDFNLLMTHPNDDQVDPTLDAIDVLLDGGGALDYSGLSK